MRILHWTDNCYPLIGGVERLIDELLVHQGAAGHTAAVVADLRQADLAREETRHGAQIRRFGFFHALEAADPRAIRAAADEVSRFQREFRPDVVHLHLSGITSLFSLLTRRAHPAPVLLTLHVPLSDPAIHSRMVRRLLETADGITTVAAFQRAAIAALDGALADKTSVVPNGLRPPDEAPRPLPWAPPRLLCLGRVVAEKGFDVALRALPALRVRWPDLRLTIAGDGPARAALVRLAAELRLDAAVEFRGWVAPAGIPALLNEATLVLMPSRWPEPFGLVAVEAAYLARPIVASRVGGIPEVVADGETGLLVPPDDPAALAAAIGRLLAAPAEAARLGAQARRRALVDFTLDRCAEEFARRYAALLRR